MSSLAISTLSFEHHRHALGIAETKPRISWRFEGNISEWEQNAYDIEILRGTASNQQVKSFSFNSSESLYVTWPDEELAEAEAASVRVRAHGREASTPWSAWGNVETGLLSDEGWAGAVPITADFYHPSNTTKRPIYLRKTFNVPDAQIESARLYITALGIYEAEINGERVGDLVLAPGWQSYHHRHVYDTYDVADLISAGENAIGAIVGEGWFLGRMGIQGGSRNIYGDSMGFLSVLVIKFDNGTKLTVPTDTTWKTREGPVVASELYDGELYDARIEADIEGWSTPTFVANDEEWHGTRALPPLQGKLTPPDQPGVRRIEERKPERIFKSPSGKTIIDFGQNMVGWLHIRASGPAGTNVTLHHAEVLDKDELALRPLRTAKAKDTIIFGGNGTVDWEPKFTYHGFRYVQVDGWPEGTPMEDGAITAVVIHTDLEPTGWFNCSNKLLNQFHSNVRWSMKGNFLSIPTDCPQRDERLGWTGDVHAFGPTSNYLYNTAGFWRSWHRDLMNEMSADGSMVPGVTTPMTPGMFATWGPSAIWGDVVVANPWNLYQAFGDQGMLAEHLPQSRGWLDVGIPRNDAGLWDRQTRQFADWLDPLSPPDSPGLATTHPFLVCDAYLVQMTAIAARIAAAVGDAAVADRYADQHETLRTEFQKAWVSTDGALANRTQTAYALAIAFDLLAEEGQRERAVETLRAVIAANGYLVGTGFAGTPTLHQALRLAGASEDFYRMLLQTRVPSWLYQVEMGATTTWERWDSMLPNGTVNPGQMTSFNHYALGSVAQFLHEVTGGIAPAEPGYRTVAVAPIPGGGITSAEARYIGPYGEIATSWSVDDDGFHLELKVPPNSRAIVTMPGSGKTVKVGSGIHNFTEAGYRVI